MKYLNNYRLITKLLKGAKDLFELLNTSHESKIYVVDGVKFNNTIIKLKRYFK